MRNTSTTKMHAVVVGAVLSLAVGRANAAENNADKSAPEAPPKAAESVEAHFTVETGVASTFVGRGMNQYQSKVNPSSMSALFLTLDHVGPGSVTLGTYNETAITNYSAQKGVGLQFDPIGFYAIRAGKYFKGTAGYMMHINPELAPAKPADGMHEFVATAALENLFVRPAVEAYVEYLRMHGAYANVNVSKSINLGETSGVSITPAVIAGMHGYDGVPLALREVTGAVATKWKFSQSGPFYAVLRASYSYTGARNFGAGQDSFSGRSTPMAMIAFGASQ